ncbi:hypothetical protein KCU81_g330, partial [Aureobasidium melanogenum]
MKELHARVPRFDAPHLAVTASVDLDHLGYSLGYSEQYAVLKARDPTLGLHRRDGCLLLARAFGPSTSNPSQTDEWAPCVQHLSRGIELVDQISEELRKSQNCPRDRLSPMSKSSVRISVHIWIRPPELAMLTVLWLHLPCPDIRSMETLGNLYTDCMLYLCSSPLPADHRLCLVVMSSSFETLNAVIHGKDISDRCKTP